MIEMDEIRREQFERADQVDREIIAVIAPLFDRLSKERPLREDEVAAVGAYFGLATAMAQYFRGQLDDESFAKIRDQYGEPSTAHDAVIDRLLKERTDLTDMERFMLTNRNIAISDSFREFSARQSGIYLRWVFDDLNLLKRPNRHSG